LNSDAITPPDAGAPPPAPPTPPGAGEPPPSPPAAAEPPPTSPPAAEPPNTQLLILKDKVQRYLADLIGGVELTADGRFTFQHGSARVFVTCTEWHGETLVTVTAPVLIECAASPELFEHIALAGDDYVFGHLFAQRADDGTVAVLLTHRLLGDFLDPDELKHAVGGVVTSGDQVDDELKTRFGGKRFHDNVA
jgi:hypothetical protein